METAVFVYDASGQLVAEYSTQTSSTPQTSYLTTDHLGSPRVVTNQLGAVTIRKDFTAFGEENFTAQRTSALGYSAPDNLRKGYTGYEKDAESGLDFAQARYYNSVHGRYTSVDPLTASASIRNPQTFNRYSYVLNSPYKHTDPLGLLPLTSAGACGNFCRNWDGGAIGWTQNYDSGHRNGWELAEMERQASAQKPVPPQTMDPDTICDPYFEEREAARTNKRQPQDTVTVTPVFRLTRIGELPDDREPGDTSPKFQGEAAYFEFFLDEDPSKPALNDYFISVVYFGEGVSPRQFRLGPTDVGTFELPPITLEIGFASGDLSSERAETISPKWQKGIVSAEFGGQVYQFHYFAWAWRENGISRAEIYWQKDRGVSGPITIPRPAPICRPGSAC